MQASIVEHTKATKVCLLANLYQWFVILHLVPAICLTCSGGLCHVSFLGETKNERKNKSEYENEEYCNIHTHRETDIHKGCFTIWKEGGRHNVTALDLFPEGHWFYFCGQQQKSYRGEGMSNTPCGLTATAMALTT